MVDGISDVAEDCTRSKLDSDYYTRLGLDKAIIRSKRHLLQIRSLKAAPYLIKSLGFGNVVEMEG